MHKKSGTLVPYASCVIAGGRGLRDSEGISLLRELACLLNGEIIATRGAVEDGLLEEWRLVGMSGSKIRAELYLAFGVSGAHFHTVGVKGDPVIFAVNTDPRARILELADWSIIGDAKDILEKLLVKCRQNRETIQSAGTPEHIRILERLFEEIKKEKLRNTRTFH